MAARLIPREGIFTPDFAISVVQSTLLNPVLTGPLLAALRYLPRETILRWSNLLHTDLPLSPLALKTITYLFFIGAARQANKLLTSLAQNNWTSDTWDWKNEVALVTGGSSGIGYHVAVGLANHGITVAIVDVQEPKLPLPSNAHFYHGDVTSNTSITSFATAIRTAHGAPTILINNAGIGAPGILPILSSSEATIRRVFAVNTISHFQLIREFLPAMVTANHGHIVTLASLASFNAIGGMVDYACTKASALAFHEGLGQELKYYNHAPKVRTSIVHPGWTRTALVQPLLDASVRFRPLVMEVETVSDAIVRRVLSGRGGTVILPVSDTVHSLVRAWPGWAQEVARGMGTRLLWVASEQGGGVVLKEGGEK